MHLNGIIPDLFYLIISIYPEKSTPKGKTMPIPEEKDGKSITNGKLSAGCGKLGRETPGGSQREQPGFF